MHAATIELLVKKARLEPDIALAFAEAIDTAMVDTQIVTVPILDTRFAAVDTRFAAVDARFAAVDARFDAIDGRLDRMDGRLDRMDGRLGAMDGKLHAMDAKLGEFKVQMSEVKAELVRWVFLVMLGNVALSLGGTALLNAIQRGH